MSLQPPFHTHIPQVEILGRQWEGRPLHTPSPFPAEEISSLSKGQVPSGHLKPAGLPASCPLHPLTQAPPALRGLWLESTYLGLGGCFLHV